MLYPMLRGYPFSMCAKKANLEPLIPIVRLHTFSIPRLRTYAWRNPNPELYRTAYSSADVIIRILII